MFHTRLEELQDQIVALGRGIEEALEQATTACVSADTALAQEVLATHRGIGKASRLIRDTALELLATQQPLASDLRLIFASMSIATDLERMGSHTRSIARLTLQGASTPQVVGRDVPPGTPTESAAHVEAPAEVTAMSSCARRLLHEVIDAFRTADAAAARRILHAEDDVDRGYQASVQVLLRAMTADVHAVPEGMLLLKVVHKLERIGDHVSNIAERTIFLSTGAFPTERAGGDGRPAAGRLLLRQR
jgi:phosphate transport system protein